MTNLDFMDQEPDKKLSSERKAQLYTSFRQDAGYLFTQARNNLGAGTDEAIVVFSTADLAFIEEIAYEALQENSISDHGVAHILSYFAARPAAVPTAKQQFFADLIMSTDDTVRFWIYILIRDKKVTIQPSKLIESVQAEGSTMALCMAIEAIGELHLKEAILLLKGKLRDCEGSPDDPHAVAIKTAINLALPNLI